MSRSLVIIVLLFSLAGLSAQPGADPDPAVLNEVTIYLIPSAAPYDWASPRSLRKSLIKNYVKNIFRKDRYLMGHTYIELRSSTGEEIVTGMHSISRDEQKQLVFQEHYGLAILGTELLGELDNSAELTTRLDKCFRKGEISFIRIDVNEDAFNRMMAFYQGYKLRLDSLETPAKCYGGAYWPRYYGEGSGCSAYVISYLDVAGVLQEEFDQWKVQVNIPMDLIGGPYNPGNEVKMKDIRKCKTWADSGIDGKDYESFWVFDPTLMHEWVMDKYKESIDQSSEGFYAAEIDNVKGIVFDAVNIPAPSDSIFMQRSDPSIFIDHYHSRMRAGN
jgi:hypothetical protein